MISSSARNIQITFGKDTKVELFKVIAGGILLYWSETWVAIQKYRDKIQSAEIKYL